MSTMQFLSANIVVMRFSNITIPIIRITVNVGDGTGDSNFVNSANQACIGKLSAVSVIAGNNCVDVMSFAYFAQSGDRTYTKDNVTFIRNNYTYGDYNYSHCVINYGNDRISFGKTPGAFANNLYHIGFVCILTDVDGNVYKPITELTPVAWQEELDALYLDNSTGALNAIMPNTQNIIGALPQIDVIPLDVNIHDISIETSLDPYTPGGDSTTGGGVGDFDDTSDPIDFPVLPTLSAVDTGFITLFNPTLAELQSLAAYMWNSSLFDIANFQKLFADPMDAILGLSIVPVSIPNAGTQPIKVGNIATSVNMNKAGVQYIEVDCGTLNVNEFWGAYLDYSPYTKAEIYLPYCGTHAIDVDDIMNKSVHVKYHVDILSGACCAYVKCGDSVLYQFSGQCSSSIPISGSDFTQMVNGVLSAAVSIGSMVATGGASAPLAVPALANTAVNGGLKPAIEKSGAISGTSGMLAIQKPYLIITRPKQALPSNQNYYTGYPSYITANLSELSGYTEIETIHLDNVSATESEINEILTLLKEGVIL